MKESKKSYNKPSVVTANAFEAAHRGKLVPLVLVVASAAGYAAGRSLTNAIKIDSFSKVNGLSPVLTAL